MAHDDPAIEHLAEVPLFRDCTARELDKIAAASTEIVAPTGRVLVDQGQTGREAFIILSGTATASRSGQTIGTLRPGEIVGELSLLDHGPRTATVTCDCECRLLVLDQRQFRSVLESVPSLSVRLLATLSARIRDLDHTYYG